MGLSRILTGARYAIVGGVATRMYQPERFTKDIDVLVVPSDLPVVRDRLREANGKRTGALAFARFAVGARGRGLAGPRDR
jgi:hypothetical protein